MFGASETSVLAPGPTASVPEALNVLVVYDHFSNLNQALDLCRDEGLRTRITERTYADVVQSGRYSYRTFVDRLVQDTLGARGRVPSRGQASVGESALFSLLDWANSASRRVDALALRLIATLRRSLLSALTQILNRS